MCYKSITTLGNREEVDLHACTTRKHFNLDLRKASTQQFARLSYQLESSIHLFWELPESHHESSLRVAALCSEGSKEAEAKY